MLAWLASTLAAAFLAIQCASAATPVPDVGPESTAKIGILAFRPKAETLARWHPLVEHLNRARLKQQFALEAYSYDELEKAIHDRKVDVVLTQPAHYIMMKYREDLYSPLATLVESEGGKAIAAFGGVIFTLERRTDLRELKDLQGKRIATSSSSSLGGYLVQAYELKRAGIELPKDAQVTQTGMPHDNVVSEVLAGRADAGFVRTGVLEAMANEGKIDLAELRVLHRNRGVQYPYMLSTELFPEWALAAMPWADGETSRQVAAAVLGLPHDGKVAKAVRITGFTIPGDYRKVDDVMRELRVPPFDKAPEFSFLDALVRYRERFLLGAAVVFTMLSALIVLLMRSNRSLARERESIHKLAFYDALTGLPNRRLLLDRLRQEISQSGRRARYSAVLFIDLDNFKTLNDTQGHQAGDELLIDVARRLRAALREGDTVARLGGDEFVLVLCDLGGSMEGALESIRTIAGKLLAAIQADLVLGSGERYRSSASIGVCPFLGDQVSVDELLKRADTAMYQAKSAGRSGISFFDPSMQHMLEARLRIESWMRESIGQHFVLFYQPQVEGDGKPTGAEALVRWMHPEHGLISPATFIPLAEETGLILQIGEWVLRSACLQIAKWETHPVASRLSIAVNVSAKQFKQPDFVEMVLATLRETSASPSRLKLELTESMLVSDVGDVATKMARLKEVGVTFSLDDFGTGYASLSVLKTLPFDQVKIDQSFVKELLLNRADAAIARTVITLGDSLDINVIAEGVETEAHRNTLAAMNCNFFQGYYFAKPMPVEDFEEWIRAKDAPAQRAPASA